MLTTVVLLFILEISFSIATRNAAAVRAWHRYRKESFYFRVQSSRGACNSSCKHIEEVSRLNTNRSPIFAAVILNVNWNTMLPPAPISQNLENGKEYI